MAQGEFKYEWGVHLSEEQSESAPAMGLPGQGNDRPRKKFRTHAILSYKTKLYEPSYGGMAYDDTNEGHELYETEKVDYFGEVIFFESWEYKTLEEKPIREPTEI